MKNIKKVSVDNKIEYAKGILSNSITSITTLTNSFIQNLNTNSSQYINSFASNNTSAENSKIYVENYFKDRYFTTIIFIIVFFMICKFYEKTFNILKKDMNQFYHQDDEDLII